MTWMLLMILVVLSFILIQMSHPLSMGLMLIVNTITTCLTISTMSESPWFSYILFLVFLGGMLVLFIYVTSLASNEMFTLTPNLFLLIFLVPLLLIVMMIIDPLLLPNMISLPDPHHYTTNYQEIPGMKFYMTSILMNTIMLATYLFITLIAVVKITSLYQGPLRPSKS
uniref:NADH-ubiquinone oxidoreductase chain 6 n=1 Tax=Thermobia domestica TaxID=89055 RepID=Q6DVK9_THEDO|nr:NADH dehydrogenase subunit 6 [Thermobia domestica]AAT69290.1 NADH dehydrogenase subunit 6 [Thermobia domestica]